MKYSARLVTGLAAVGLLIAVLVVLGNTTRNAFAAVDGQVYLTNKWSTLTTQSSAPSGRTYVGSGKTLYSTFVERNAAGTAEQTIETNSDVVIITVIDADADLKTSATSSETWTSATTSGATQFFPLALAKSPIVDDTGDGRVDTNDVSITNVVGTGTLTVANVAPGSTTAQAGVLVGIGVPGTVSTFQLNWKISAADTVSVTVKSTNEISGITFNLTETALTGGKFEGEVQLIDAADSTQTSTTTGRNKIRILNGGTLTVEYSDSTPASGTTAKKITTTLAADTTAPAIVATSPVNKSATQNRRPVFSGSISDTGGAGLKIAGNNIKIFVAKADPTNATRVDIAGADDEFAASAATGAADGDQSTTFSLTPSSDLPTSVAPTVKPDHQTDWQVRTSDLAGNVAFSDSDASTANDTTGPTPGRGQSHVVRIDQVLPVMKHAITGYSWDTTLTTPARTVGVATSIEVVFDSPIDAASVQATDFQATIGGATQVPSSASVFSGQANSVFLTFPTAIPAADKPVVSMATGGSIADTAGNNLSTGSITSVDGLAPTLTVALSGGSSTAKPTSLTKSTIDITVTADEALSSITIQIFNSGSTTVAEQTLNVIPQGGNVFKATTVASTADGDKSVWVSASDQSVTAFVDLNQDGLTTGTNETVGLNNRTAGKKDVTDSAAIKYKFDATAPALTITPADAGTTDERRPFVILDWGEAIATINKATFNATDIVSSLVASSDKKKWIYKSGSDLSLAKQTVVAQATDEAGNKSAEITRTFTVVERVAFSLSLNPGWNLVSLRSEPADTAINSVVTTSDISTVITYDPVAKGGPWLVATRGTDGKLTGSLTSVDGQHGYWVNTSSFEPIKVLDPKPQGGTLPPAILVVAGWNLVPARDVSGTLTAGTVITTADKYFNGTKITRAYKFDTLTGKYVQLVLTGTTPSDIKVGEAYWAYFTEAGAVIP